MDNPNHGFISLTDLGMAYRKAKVDLFYSSHASVSMIAAYEENLYKNLNTLQEKLNQSDESWVTDRGFSGGWTLVPKAIEYEKLNNATICSSPLEHWLYVCKISKKKPVAEFRLMAKTSMDFHVLSALWIEKVGHKYDSCLSRDAWGNRLKRNLRGEINPYSSGSIQPYFNQFRIWRDNGIKSMRQALNEKKKVVAVTVDVDSFYHELNPEFLEDTQFITLLEIELTNEERKLNRIFLNALKEWASMTPLKKGLPVGLPASAVVANMAFYALDNTIQKNMAPLYYGRYVDDIILVLENSGNFSSAKQVWEWMISQSNGLLNWLDSKKKDTVSYSTTYLKNSRVWFSNQKNKVFILEGANGLTLIESLSKGIQDRASEWRALPNLPDDPINVATDLLAATQRDGEAADSLRKTDSLTIRRAGFAMKLRDFEAYERDLPPGSWSEYRHAFFQAVIHHILVLPAFFDLEIYLPRIIRMAVACEDFEILEQILNTLKKLIENVKTDCRLKIKACKNDFSDDGIYQVWQKQLFQTIGDSIKVAFPARLSKQGKKDWNKYFGNNQELFDSDYSISAMEKIGARLFSFDLAHIPFRYIKLPKEFVDRRMIPAQKSIIRSNSFKELIVTEVYDGLTILTKWLKLTSEESIPNGFLFPTRPFSLTDLYFLKSDPYKATYSADIDKIIFALRGYSVVDKLPTGKQTFQIPFKFKDNRKNIKIALASWKTESKSWEASVLKLSDPDVHRYKRLTNLINTLLSQSKGIHYFIMPELSIPARWFMRIVKKFLDSRISLISGVEYLHRRNKTIRNQVWTALWHDSLGYPSTAIIKQDKQHPALHEEQELKKLAGLVMKPGNKWKTPPLIQHGNFQFAMVVCSELTNIDYRGTLRGRIDALFVPQWNQDIDSFNSLVESSALDIHAFIIQCNDRQYGDSRIRAPYKDNWRRDIIRIRGGITDYFVIGEIDIGELRSFQSSDKSPDEPFKPVPDGFKISPERKTTPKKEKGV